jgi:hypothetical protein
MFNTCYSEGALRSEIHKSGIYYSSRTFPSFSILIN